MEYSPGVYEHSRMWEQLSDMPNMLVRSPFTSSRTTRSAHLSPQALNAAPTLALSAEAAVMVTASVGA